VYRGLFILVGTQRLCMKVGRDLFIFSCTHRLELKMC
jgi:hypothetical protein